MADGFIKTIARMLTPASAEPQTTAVSATGPTGERRLARRLDDELPHTAIVLHDRKVPNTRGTIDHLAIAPSGIWLVDTKHYAGTVERRTVGAPWARRARLHLDGDDQTALADGMSWQTVAVRAHLDTIRVGDVPIRPVLCFAGSNWGRHTPPFEIGKVLVTTPGTLVTALSAHGPITGDTIARLAEHLDLAIPAGR